MSKKFTFYSKLPTEKVNPNTFNIDRIPLKEVLKKLNEEDKKVPVAISKRLTEISKAAKMVSKTFLNGGTIVFVGAGTSGRLGILEAAELVPTYGVSTKQFKAIIAGGKDAVFKAKEGAEDIYSNGKETIRNLAKKDDVLIAIAASGVTPYVKGAINGAKQKKAFVIFITSNTKEKPKNCDIIIDIDVGPEPINGSTRMKSGTATKLVLNMITTSAMIISGKVYHNWMVDLKPTNYKLVMRAERIFCEITGLNRKTARKFLKNSDYNVKTAIVMALKGTDKKQTEMLIKNYKGFLKDIIDK